MKPVILEGRPIGDAATLREAAECAIAAGVLLDLRKGHDLVQHVGEGPRAFYVTREPGGRAQ